MSANKESFDYPDLDRPRTQLEDFKYSHLALIIIAGIFATTLAQPQVMGKLPLQHLLKDNLHVSREAMARFFFLCGLAWYFKPFAGILTDAFPLFGTRRRYYLLASAIFAGVSWVGIMLVPKTYDALLYGCIIINFFMVIASTVIGAFLVESGQRLGATGRLTALRQTVSNACQLINGPVSGYLAGLSFGLASGVNAAIVVSVVPIAYLFMREKRVREENAEPLKNAKIQLGIIFRSPNLWFAILFIFLFYFSPGFSTPLYYKQTDQLKFSQEFIGWLQVASGAFGILGAYVYSRLIKRLDMMTMIVAGILTFALGNLLYLMYSGATMAWIIESQNGFFFTLAEIALLDLAARATPKGCEGLGYSLMLSARNLALFGADWLGSFLADKQKWSFETLVFLNVGTTLVVLLLLPILPKLLMNAKDKVMIATGDESVAGTAGVSQAELRQVLERLDIEDSGSWPAKGDISVDAISRATGQDPVRIAEILYEIRRDNERARRQEDNTKG
ncbi:MFS transporter [Fimbriimonas ginsengisoli]|uniref:Folate transporter n=1 Tax=Fimbriimonas ginsengisoli Gsoil 348 TaxID=661478 RepID=A0A068NW06_FIMGI|nr:MFS transporter [Fimbriimonas ginsengisoli]AIE87708.1 folate transporter [Fimbriimonas ginsengisoli Gsoil 348]